MRRIPTWVSICAIGVTGAVSIWLSTRYISSWFTPWHYGYNWLSEPYYAAAVVCCAVCAFLEGCALHSYCIDEIAALGWALAGAVFLCLFPDPSSRFDPYWYHSDCVIPEFAFDPEVPCPLLVPIHYFVLFYVAIPAIAFLSARHGRAFRSDKNVWRPLWVVAMVVLICASVLYGHRLFYAH